MLKLIAKSFLGQFVGVGLFAGGFWLLFKALEDSNIPIGILGGAMILLGMWVMTMVRRSQSDRDESSDPSS